MSVQRVTPSKLGKASIRLIWARTHVAIPESVSKGGRADDEGESIIGKRVRDFGRIKGDTRKGMMEAQGWIVQCSGKVTAPTSSISFIESRER